MILNVFRKLFIKKRFCITIYSIAPELKNKSDLIEELKIKEKQIAIHHAESDIVGVSAPIFKDDKVIASIGVYLPESRFKYKTQKTIITGTKKTATYINDQLKRLKIRFNDLE